MSEWLLTRKEIKDMPVPSPFNFENYDRAIAQAQLRKVIEVISGRQDECMADLGLFLAQRKVNFVSISTKAWGELKGEAGLKEPEI